MSWPTPQPTKAPTLEPGTTAKPTDGGGGGGGGGGGPACASGWQLEPVGSDRCYKAFPLPADTPWENARRLCRAAINGKGADLATITSEDENKFVSSLITTNSFLGCNDIKPVEVLRNT